MRPLLILWGCCCFWLELDFFFRCRSIEKVLKRIVFVHLGPIHDLVNMQSVYAKLWGDASVYRHLLPYLRLPVSSLHAGIPSLTLWRARGLTAQRLYCIAKRALQVFQPGGKLFPGLEKTCRIPS